MSGVPRTATLDTTPARTAILRHGIIWFASDRIFELDTNDTEHLTYRGKRLLDAALSAVRRCHRR